MTIVGGGESNGAAASALEATDQKIKVAVRVRPLNKRELDLGTKTVIRMSGSQTLLENPTDENKSKPFAFDFSFDSSDPNCSQFASQEQVFKDIGFDLLENSFAGYNACLFAYGQTSSGKSYSMMGTAEQPGIIPRLCNEIFKRIEQTTSDSLSYKVEVSYMEIYNERVRDLLDPKKSNKPLKVREHKILGPIVDGLSTLAVDSYMQIESLIAEGNKSRTVAATNMNAESSRSHAVFNITLTQTLKDIENGFSGEKVSKMSLVDLAGSERVAKTGAMGKRLEEGGSINKSLTTLGMVISALAERSTKKDKFIPYRDSVLTWLLRDNLGGNSRTVMIATLSPAADNYEETLSTLRYADRAKRIVNHAVVNEDPNARIIRELREEVESLRMQISHTKKEQTETMELRERLAESERLVEQMNKSWEERLKETQALNKERQRDLSEIGISIESSGIKVEKDKFYLVNLNADPSLNELLVYYINETAIVGNTEEIDTSRDSGLGSSVEELHAKTGMNDKTNIVLRGLGVMHRHARLTVVSEETGKQKRLYVEPLTAEGRVFVNGLQIHERTLLKNGYRLLFGINHFFKVNCPKDPMDVLSMEESRMFDYKDAWEEVNGDSGGGGISAAVDELMQRVTQRHEEDKKLALEQQYEAFEQYIHNLAAGGLTPSTPMTPSWNLPTPLSTPASALPPFPFAGSRQTVKNKFFHWAQKRKEMFAESLKRLKADLMRAHALATEANMMSKELGGAGDKRITTYHVTLHIPAANLRPSKIKAGAFVCEPVIVVRRVGMHGAQLWSMSQLENKLIDMRELYDDRMSRVEKEKNENVNGYVGEEAGERTEAEDDKEAVTIDPFFESQEQHSLIGVANVFLEVLLHDLRLDYQVPIISQQGEVAGRLHVQVYRVAGPVESEEEKAAQQERGIDSLIGKVITCRVRIKRVSDLPESLSNFVFCQYSFFNASEMLVVAPSHDLSHHQPANHSAVVFEHQRDFNVVVTEEFLEYVQEDALSIEVWGHRSCGFEQNEAARRLDADERNKSLQARWAEVSRRIELWVEINELNENGEWTPVECRQYEDVTTGGVYQLKQGQQRRIVVGVSLPTHEGLPLQIDSIHSVTIGCIWSRKPNVHKQLDSYQEEDLETIRSQWTQALQTRQKYLEEQLDKLSNRCGKSEAEKEKEREQSLMAQWIALTEERAAVAIPAPNSRIPGAPCDWNPPPGKENHVPVVFLDLDADDMSGEANVTQVALRTAGMHSILPLESEGQFIVLPSVHFDEKHACVACSWDSSVHDSPALNQVTSANERVYAILKATVRLSHPCVMDVVLRKRICMQVYKKGSSFAERFLKRMIGCENPHRTSVLYDVVAYVPKSSCDVEERESLALLAAQHAMKGEAETETEQQTELSSARPQLSYIEAYANSIQAVESMLKLDRLRQEVAITNMLSRKERKERLQHLGLPQPSFRMKRAVSLPNAISNGLAPSPWPASLQQPCDSPMNTSATTSMAVNSNSNSQPRPVRPSFLPLGLSPSASATPTPRLTSLISPATERLSGIEEINELCPVRSSTVPEALHTNTKDLSNEQMDMRNGNLPLASTRPLGECSAVSAAHANAMLSTNKTLKMTGLDLKP